MPCNQLPSTSLRELFDCAQGASDYENDSSLSVAEGSCLKLLQNLLSLLPIFIGIQNIFN